MFYHMTASVVKVRNEITPYLVAKLEPAFAVLAREFRVNPSQIAGVGSLEMTTREGRKDHRAILCKPGSNDRLQNGGKRLTVADMIREIGLDPKGEPVYLIKFVDGQGGVHTSNSIAMVRTVNGSENELYVIDMHSKIRKGALKTIFHLDRKKAAEMEAVLINDHILSSPNAIHNYYYSGAETSMGCDLNREWGMRNELTMTLLERPYEDKEQAREIIEFAQDGLCD